MPPASEISAEREMLLSPMEEAEERQKRRTATAYVMTAA
jgi:hypothetical protein